MLTAHKVLTSNLFRVFTGEMFKKDLFLLQRKMGNFRGKSKQELVELFYKTLLPMPQRKYRMNRRGKAMTKQQILMAKRKRTHQEANQDDKSKSNEVVSIYR